MHWFIDGNNVMGAAGDGWWNDPVAAAVRLTRAIALWCRGHEDPVTLVFDGPEEGDVAEQAGGNLSVGFATRTGRDAADDRIVELVDELVGTGSPEQPGIVVVTSDRGLRRRLPDHVRTCGAGRFRSHALLDGRDGRGGR